MDRNDKLCLPLAAIGRGILKTNCSDRGMPSRKVLHRSGADQVNVEGIAPPPLTLLPQVCSKDSEVSVKVENCVWKGIAEFEELKRGPPVRLSGRPQFNFKGQQLNSSFCRHCRRVGVWESADEAYLLTWSRSRRTGDVHFRAMPNKLSLLVRLLQLRA